MIIPTPVLILAIWFLFNAALVLWMTPPKIKRGK